MDEPESVLDDLDGINFTIVSDVKTSKDHKWRVRVKASRKVYVVDEAIVCTQPDFDEKMRDFERSNYYMEYDEEEDEEDEDDKMHAVSRRLGCS